MIEVNGYCNEVIKKHFNKELVMNKEVNEDYKNSTTCWIFENDYIDHCYITEKYRGSAHRDFNINLKIIDKIPIVFHNLRNYNSHLIMQEIGKFNLKVSVIPNGF